MAVKTKARLGDMELLNRVPIADRMADPAQWVGELLEAASLKLDPVIHESLAHGRQILRYNLRTAKQGPLDQPVGVLSCGFVRDLAKMTPMRALNVIHIRRAVR